MTVKCILAVPSTVDDYGRGIVGVARVFQDTGITASDIDEVLHGTTVASNAIWEMAGAKTGLITTEGFKGVELRTLRMPRLYDIGWVNLSRSSTDICAWASRSESTAKVR